jgi:hypothetical protein
LRKKLRHQLGYDPINSVRYLGYRLDDCGFEHHACARAETAFG